MKVGKPLKEPANLGSNPSPITPYWVTRTIKLFSLSLNFLICKMGV